MPLCLPQEHLFAVVLELGRVALAPVDRIGVHVKVISGLATWSLTTIMACYSILEPV